LARVELRQLRHHAGRSTLVVLLVAVPVAALVGGSALLEITETTPEERRAAAMGQATLRVDNVPAALVPAVLDELPAGARVERTFIGHEQVRVPGRRLVAKRVAVESGALGPEGLSAGYLRLTSGRAPEEADEVALSPVLLAGLERAVGEHVELGPVEARITGVVIDPENLDLPVVLHPLPEGGGDARDGAEAGARSLLVQLAPEQARRVAKRLRAAGHRVGLRADHGQPDPFLDVAIFVLSSFGFFEAALVVAAAFAVGFRRRQREIGLLGSCGAAPAGLRAALLASAGLLGLLGSLLGVAVGLALAAGVHPFLDGWNRRWNGDFELSVVHVAGAFALGVVASVAAAAFPARTAVALPIRVALSGRRPVAGSSSRWLRTGLGLLALGSVAVLWGGLAGHDAAGVAVLAGSILGVLGFGASSPWLLDQLARRAGPLPLSWRLAVRDAGRFRARNGPVVTAVVAGMSVAVLMSALVGSVEATLDARMAEHRSAARSDQLVVRGAEAEQVAAEIRRELPALAHAPLTAAYAGGELVVGALSASADSSPAFESWVACGDEELLRVLDLERAAPALAAGKLVAVLDPAAPLAEVPGKVALRAGGRALPELAVEAVASTELVRAPLFVVGAGALAAREWSAGPAPGEDITPWVVRLERDVTSDLARRAQALAARSTGTAVDAEVLRRATPRAFLRIVVLLCFTTGLIVIFVATALSSVESGADARVLHTVGAAPGVLQRHVAARAGYLAFLGCLLAVPAGLIPAAGLIRLTNFVVELSLPWPELIATAAGPPLAAYFGTWAFVALRGTGSGPERATP
jgi:putative ABC transport system permease protein